MKTFIKNFLVSLLTVTLSTGSLMAMSAEKEQPVTVLNVKNSIYKVVANGNVEVLLTQSNAESVKIHDQYYGKNALIQQEGDVLRISSFGKEKLTVIVSARQLGAVEASGDAVVKSVGKLGFVDFQIALRDRAKAEIQLSSIQLFTSVKDHSALKISGNSIDHVAELGTLAKLNMGHFKAENTTVSSVANVIAKKAVQQAVPSLNELAFVDEFVREAK